jgi:DNA-binding response OmpR family regulator
MERTQHEVENKARQVLLVDDEHRLRDILARYLRARGHTVIEAGSAAEARAALDAAPVDVLLLDVNLPDDTGWDVLRWLRARSSAQPTEPITVVIISAVPPSAKRIEQFAPDAVLNKPFPIDALARLVESGCRPVAVSSDFD